MRLILSVTTTALIISSTCHAQDECREVLLRDLSNTNTHLYKSDSKESDRLYYCSATLDEAKSYFNKQKENSSSSGGGLSVGYGPFTLGGNENQANSSSDSLTDEKYSSWKSNNCSDAEKSSENHAYEYDAQRTINDENVKAWLQCKLAQDGLNCWTEPHEIYSILHVNWRSDNKSDATVKQSSLFGGVSHWDGAPPTKLLPLGYVLDRGQTAIPIERSGGGEVDIVLNISQDGAARECTGAIPKIPPPPKPEAPPPVQHYVATGQILCHGSLVNCAFDNPKLKQFDPSINPYASIEFSPAVKPFKGQVSPNSELAKGIGRYNFTVKEQVQ